MFISSQPSYYHHLFSNPNASSSMTLCGLQKPSLPIFVLASSSTFFLHSSSWLFFRSVNQTLTLMQKLSNSSIYTLLKYPNPSSWPTYFIMFHGFTSLYLSSHLDLARTATFLSSNSKTICVSGPRNSFCLEHSEPLNEYSVLIIQGSTNISLPQSNWF